MFHSTDGHTINKPNLVRLICSLGALLLGSVSMSSSELTMPFPRPDLATVHNPFTFIVYGDVQDIHENGHRKLVNQMEKESAAFIINTGDISPNHGRNYENFYTDIYNLAAKIPFFSAPGNHDIEFMSETSRYPYHEFFRNAYDFLADRPLNEHLAGSNNQRLWYSFQYATALFIALDSNLLIDSGRYRKTNLLPEYRNYAVEQSRWVKQVLEKSDSDPGIKSKFIFFHHSPFISKRNTRTLGLFGGHEDDSRFLINSKISEPDGSEIHLLDLFRRHRVNAVFTGHQHYYERWRETIDDGSNSVHILNWIIVGSGGVKPRENLEYADKETENLVKKEELYDQYLKRISIMDPGWKAKLERIYPNRNQPSGKIQDYLLIQVNGNHVSFKTTDSDGAVRDSGLLTTL